MNRSEKVSPKLAIVGFGWVDFSAPLFCPPHLSRLKRQGDKNRWENICITLVSFFLGGTSSTRLFAFCYCKRLWQSCLHNILNQSGDSSTDRITECPANKNLLRGRSWMHSRRPFSIVFFFSRTTFITQYYISCTSNIVLRCHMYDMKAIWGMRITL